MFVVCDDGGGGGGGGGGSRGGVEGRDGPCDVLVCRVIQVIQLPGELQSLSSQHIDSFRENVEFP